MTSRPDNSLYERLGGYPVVRAVVGDVVDRTAANPKSKQSFDEVNVKNLKKSIVEQICSLTEGPCTYGGDDMQTAHKGLNISEGEFNILAEELRQALDAHGVGTREKNELLRILAPMKRDIVTR
ncbi:MAG: group 1 truncated hemoglobin [Pseudomonadota bacterium]|nr:group 1 truncated hemoglobin [Pseudomonadota bacterium]